MLSFKMSGFLFHLILQYSNGLGHYILAFYMPALAFLILNVIRYIVAYHPSWDLVFQTSCYKTTFRAEGFGLRVKDLGVKVLGFGLRI